MVNRAMASPTVRYGSLLVLLLSLVGVAYTIALLVKEQRAIGRTVAITSASERFLSSIKDVETGYRGYVISGSEAYLEPYQTALKKLDQDTETFRDAVARSAIDPARVEIILSNTLRKLDFARTVVEARRVEGIDGAKLLIDTRRGKTLMDMIRTDINAVQETAAREAREEQESIQRLPLIGSVSIAGLLLASIFFVWSSSRSRAQSRQIQRLLGDVIQRAPVGLALVNRHGVIVQSNASFADLVGTPSDKIDGNRLTAVARPIAEKILGDVRALTTGRALAPKIENDRQETIELETDGRTSHVTAMVFPVALDPSDDVKGTGVGIVLTDLTKQREWEMELEEARDSASAANRAKSAFIANMSHELRTPLTAVLGYCELLEDELKDMGEQSLLADLNKISINARHLLGLINDVLDLSKIEAQKMDVHAVDFTLDKMMHEVEAAVGSLISKNDNTFAVVTENAEQAFHSDDLKIKQVLLNLIGNAAKFTQHGRIELRATGTSLDGKPATRFTISDTGIGMTPDQVANLFKRFAQADETTTRRYGGTGLGLALTKAITTMLGGNITVESVPNKGSTFSVTIPNRYEKPVVSQPDDAPIIETAERPSSPGTRAKPPVLVVEDDASARDVLRRLLTKEGFAVVTANDGRSGLAKAREIKPLAVLLDIMLPGMDGWHVLRALRSDPATAAIPVIVQTVLDQEHFAYAMGATAFLKKPIKRAVLSEMLGDIAKNAPGGHVLVVDDDPDAVDRVSQMFARDGWRVSGALSGKEALAEMEKAVPSLLLVDLLMPEMDGYTFIRAVRARPEWTDIPIVVLTAEDISSERVSRLKETTSDIVQKGAKPLADLVADLRKFANDHETRETGGDTPAQ